jgi:hypothetical protein
VGGELSANMNAELREDVKNGAESRDTSVAELYREQR